MLAFKHNAGGYGTPGTLASNAETSGGPISLHTAIRKARCSEGEAYAKVWPLQVPNAEGFLFQQVLGTIDLDVQSSKRALRNSMKATCQPFSL